MPFTHNAVRTFISEKIAQLTMCGATDVSKEFAGYDNWVSRFGLKAIFNDQPPQHTRALALQLIRRAEMALAEYGVACRELTDLVSGSRGRWSPYFRALYHFEAAVAQMYQGYDYQRKALTMNVFKKDDGSDLDRLNTINNVIKHEVAGADQPMWISNEGLECKGVRLKFTEAEELLRSDGQTVERILAGG